MHWSPNGKWIVLHSHLGGDDVWLVPADGSAPAVQITEGGSETGWPRWSPDGRWIQYPSYTQLPEGGRSSDLYLIGIDQETGEVTSPPTPIDLEGFPFDAMQGEWLGGSDEIVFESAEGPDVKGLYRVSRSGGAPRLIHRFETPQVFAGLGASPDGKWVAYVAPGADGWLQIFRVSSSGGVSEQITFDPSDKTQPAYSPDGTRIAFTVFSYLVHFWAIDPRDQGPGVRGR
jgi:Tol biopolymer transport system component